MVRSGGIALGVSLVALTAAGMRRANPGTEVTGPVDLASLREAADSAQSEHDEPRVAFSLPESPWAVLEGAMDFFPLETEEAAEGSAVQPSAETPRFPKRQEWQTFMRRLDFALAAGSMNELIALEPEAQTMLDALEAIPGRVEYADWLRARIDDIGIAKSSAPIPAATGNVDIPFYHAWYERLRERPAPARAADFVPRLKPFFVAAQVPPALVWLAETESNFNPAAVSRVGARGLYQIMPETARELGLQIGTNDDRLNPQLNAQSAARYLARLNGVYRDWPLALAAYNAGPTRVSRLLKTHQANSFAEIAAYLPTETQLYVPKALATLAVREGVTPEALAMTQAALALR